ncbi:hypothetical protein [Candidatus Hecatella orcuttiae]|uniref:hypothetical protein n=1 Tax=Candidatus Hecatella orcuttiae TaxID=1935119 RepID=UPI0028683008|nr:hypothetical protein [Candidatus Hecatella orcuttiae]
MSEENNAKNLARRYFENKFGTRIVKLTIGEAVKGAESEPDVWYVNFELEVTGENPVAGAVPVNVRMGTIKEPSEGWF